MPLRSELVPAPSPACAPPAASSRAWRSALACREATGASSGLPILDARMEEVYWAQYRFDEGWRPVIEPALSTVADVLPEGGVTACGNGLAAYGNLFASRVFTH